MKNLILNHKRTWHRIFFHIIIIHLTSLKSDSICFANEEGNSHVTGIAKEVSRFDSHDSVGNPGENYIHQTAFIPPEVTSHNTLKHGFVIVFKDFRTHPLFPFSHLRKWMRREPQKPHAFYFERLLRLHDALQLLHSWTVYRKVYGIQFLLLDQPLPGHSKSKSITCIGNKY